MTQVYLKEDYDKQREYIANSFVAHREKQIKKRNRRWWPFGRNRVRYDWFE